MSGLSKTIALVGNAMRTGTTVTPAQAAATGEFGAPGAPPVVTPGAPPTPAPIRPLLPSAARSGTALAGSAGARGTALAQAQAMALGAGGTNKLGG